MKGDMDEAKYCYKKLLEQYKNKPLEKKNIQKSL